MSIGEKSVQPVHEQTWFHGSRQVFQDWRQRQAISSRSSPFHVQSFVSLSMDPACTYVHNGGTGLLCTARLQHTARIIDLRDGASDMERALELLRETTLGRHNFHTSSFETYVHACRSGLITHYACHLQHMPPEVAAIHALRTGKSFSRREKADALFGFKNFLQKWIDASISPYRELGYDGVICNESEAPGVVCTQLFVFDTTVLTPPEWIAPLKR